MSAQEGVCPCCGQLAIGQDLAGGQQCARCEEDDRVEGALKGRDYEAWAEL